MKTHIVPEQLQTAYEIDEISLKSIAAAQLGLDVLKVKEHSYRLAFALTGFKLQGRTLLASID